MSHEFESGFFHATPPWHGLGTVLEDPPETASQAICAAGLNWDVRKEPMEAVVAVNGTYRAVAVPDNFAMIRRKMENGVTKLDTLGVVGAQYRVIQNIDAFRCFDPCIATGKVQYHTAGSLRGGRIIWVLGIRSIIHVLAAVGYYPPGCSGSQGAVILGSNVVCEERQ
ncbi:DUF932 domain-containing protein, partial [Myxococcota bacterium]|nr:DUF932 domain-containing protein [Myxococcota bacterium]